MTLQERRLSSQKLGACDRMVSLVGLVSGLVPEVFVHYVD